MFHTSLEVAIETPDLTSIASPIGARFIVSRGMDYGAIIPHSRDDWGHELQDDFAQARALFLNDANANPIFISGDARDTDYCRTGSGRPLILQKARSDFLIATRFWGAMVTANTISAPA